LIAFGIARVRSRPISLNQDKELILRSGCLGVKLFAALAGSGFCAGVLFSLWFSINDDGHRAIVG